MVFLNSVNPSNLTNCIEVLKKNQLLSYISALASSTTNIVKYIFPASEQKVFSLAIGVIFVYHEFFSFCLILLETENDCPEKLLLMFWAWSLCYIVIMYGNKMA